MAEIDPVDRAYDEHDAAEREAVKQAPGYFNRCSVCGHIAAVHGEGTIIGGPNVTGGRHVEPHEFKPVVGEGMRASEAPTWDDYEGLVRRVEALEEVINKLDGRTT